MIIVEPIRLAIVATTGAAVSLIGTGLLIRFLAARRILDHPNARSSHSVPTPRGGGIAVLIAVTVGWLLGGWLAGRVAATDLLILAPALALGLVSFVDDLRSLPTLPRFLAQIAAILPGLWLLSEGGGGPFSQLLPIPLDLALTGFLWLWFTNLFNFMDGIDGITGIETASIGIGIAGLAAAGLVPADLIVPALTLSAAALGFLVWNWHPSRIFMGDVGSIPAGFLLGWLLIRAASGETGSGGAWAVALILPAYYLADATLTLLRRLVKGRNVLQAHREHFYQRAVIRGYGHAGVCGRVIAANAALILIAWAQVSIGPGVALCAAAAIVLMLLTWMAGSPRGLIEGPEND